MQIAIPSKGRPSGVRSQKILPSAVVYVPDNEVSSYQACGVQNVIGVPLEVRGITKTRNWILDNAGHSEVVFVDDDVKTCGYIKLFEQDARHKRMTPLEWEREFEMLFGLAYEFGYPIWGISTDGAPRSVYPWLPFMFQSYITASCMGMFANQGIRFDESFPVKEDYELTLRCVRDYGGVLAARHIYWNNSHWIDNGGCKDYRTQ